LFYVENKYFWAQHNLAGTKDIWGALPPNFPGATDLATWPTLQERRDGWRRPLVTFQQEYKHGVNETELKIFTIENFVHFCSLIKRMLPVS